MYEHITGGGLPADGALPGWWREARAVQRAVTALFRAWGRLPLVTTCDARLGHDGLPADEVVRVAPGTGLAALSSLASRCGAALVVAPETGGVLARASAVVERTGALLLGSPSAAVAAAADKGALSRRLKEAGRPVPACREAAGVGEAREAAAAIGYPVVVKPRLGAACEGVGKARDDAELEEAMAAARRVDGGPVLVQRLEPGEAMSVSLLAVGGRACALCLNAQDVVLGPSASYRGGTAGVDHGLRDVAFLVARDAVELVPGLTGLVGVDLIVGAGGCRVLEINPRVTTPVLALPRALQLDLAPALWRACVDGVLPPGPVAVRRPVPFSVEGHD